MKAYVVVTFYKFVALEEHELMREPLLKSMKTYKIKGTIIIASEGINGTFCGFKEDVLALISWMKSYDGLTDLVFRETYHDVNPFDKAKVKLRQEIVTMGINGIDPNQFSGTHLEPTQWNELLADPEVMIIDTRNDYEVKLGTFKSAINPGTENFRDFPGYVKKHLANQKKKKIAMFCTGGIRCEKSTAYLRKLGFENVYQLQGGILNYLQEIPAEQSLWEGTCFVFDDRVALDKHLNSLETGTIDSNWKNNHKKKFASAACAVDHIVT